MVCIYKNRETNIVTASTAIPGPLLLKQFHYEARLLSKQLFWYANQEITLKQLNRDYLVTPPLKLLTSTTTAGMVSTSLIRILRGNSINCSFSVIHFLQELVQRALHLSTFDIEEGEQSQGDPGITPMGSHTEELGWETFPVKLSSTAHRQTPHFNTHDFQDQSLSQFIPYVTTLV